MQGCQKFRGAVIGDRRVHRKVWPLGTSLLLVGTQPDDLCPEFAKTEVDLPRDALCRTRWCVCSVHNSQLQKSPSRISGQISGNSVDISKAFFGLVIWKFESSQVSQAVTQLEIVGPLIR
jgi:hypothetical protein